MRSEGYCSCPVCLSVCVSTTILGLQATRRFMSDTNSFSATRARKLMWRFRLNGCVQEIWHENQAKKPICIMSTGFPRPADLARSAHRGRSKSLRGYLSKSSPALKPLTITQLACELSGRRLWVQRPGRRRSGERVGERIDEITSGMTEI